MSRVTDHTHAEKIGGDSINFYGHPSWAGNRYDKNIMQLDQKVKISLIIKSFEISRSLINFHEIVDPQLYFIFSL